MKTHCKYYDGNDMLDIVIIHPQRVQPRNYTITIEAKVREIIDEMGWNEPLYVVQLDPTDKSDAEWREDETQSPPEPIMTADDIYYAFLEADARMAIENWDHYDDSDPLEPEPKGLLFDTNYEPFVTMGNWPDWFPF